MNEEKEEDLFLDEGDIFVTDHLKITDGETGKVILDKRGDIIPGQTINNPMFKPDNNQVKDDEEIN